MVGQLDETRPELLGRRAAQDVPHRLVVVVLDRVLVNPQDLLDLLGGAQQRLEALERRVADHLGFAHVLVSTGQVYPRSLDLDVISALAQVTAAPSNLATSIRLMAGHELVTEGFQPGQVGSSAMPHKMNTRSCERVNGLAVIIRGYLSMIGELAGPHSNAGRSYAPRLMRP